MVQTSFHSATRSKLISILSEHRFFVLFLFLLGSLLLYPYAQQSGFGYAAFRFVGSAVILLSVYAVSFRPTLVIFALALAIPALVQRLRLLPPDASLLSILNIVLSFIFDVFIIVIIFRRVFAKNQPNSETIFGALSIYLLVGFGFAGVYGMVNTLQPNAFYLNPVVNWHTTPDRFDFIYYSFGTISTLGATGITAVSPQARSVAVIEAILGILYLAVLISRLVGAYQPHGSSGES
jgi:hypothetical protein